MLIISVKIVTLKMILNGTNDNYELKISAFSNDIIFHRDDGSIELQH